MYRYLLADVGCSEANCEPRRTDNVQGQIYEHILALNGGYCVYPSEIFLQRAYWLQQRMFSFQCFIV